MTIAMLSSALSDRHVGSFSSRLLCVEPLGEISAQVYSKRFTGELVQNEAIPEQDVIHTRMSSISLTPAWMRLFLDGIAFWK